MFSFGLSQHSYLSCSRDKQTKAVYGNIDCDTHAGKTEVTLPHDGLESFVQGLKERQKKEQRENKMI